MDMKTESKPKRFTLTLPVNVHEELTNIAAEKGVSARDIVLKCLKLGLLAISLDDDPNKELVIKELTEANEMKETKLLLM